MVAPTCGSQRGGSCSVPSVSAGDIAPLYGLPYSERFWGQGFVRQGQHIFLFVTLDKKDHVEAFQYKDHFLSPAEFEWQSQNRTTQEGRDGQTIRNHNEQGVTIQLFIRAKAKTPDGRGESFLYCGLVNFVSWTGEKPITVVWSLAKPLPEPLWGEFGLASEVDKSQ
jgi:hypothetical protein